MQFKCLIGVLALVPGVVFAQEVKPPNQELTKSVTKHSLVLPSGKVDYTATAAQIPLRNETGEVECRMFYVAYEKDGAKAQDRPVTFAFNGGPGSSTI